MSGGDSGPDRPDDTPGSAAESAADHPEDDPIEVGVELLSKLEFGSLSVADAIDRIETVTTHPRTTRAILDEAERRGVIDRESGEVYPQGGAYVSFQSEVVVKEGDFDCRRCGASIREGHFIDLDAGELGPFGSSCIRKVTGRE